jgi:hypothetical protein
MSDRLTSNKSCDYEEFTDMVHALLKSAWGNDWGTFTEAFPNGTDPKNVTFPVITYQLKEKRPGIVGKGVQEIKPRFRQEFSQEDSQGKTQLMNVYSQVYDNDMCFEVWEENNVKANQVAKRFEDFMRVYTGYFKSNGVKEIIFINMSQVSESGRWKDDIVCRNYKYLVRLEAHTVIPSDVIAKVTGTIAIASNLSDDSIDSKDSIKFKF